MKKDLVAELEKNLPAEAAQLSTTLKKADAVIDYEFSRVKYKELIEKSEQAIERALQLALESEHPNAFEALSNMLHNTTVMIDRLMKLQHSMKDFEKKTGGDKQQGLPSSDQPKLQQTNVFVGSPSDLQKMLKERDINI